ncbi:MAG: HAMP domain-containing histidine kinase [Micromonosporaceae bacterium]|nr:HAMP domain-containing histidine kinase [Micromonosporaceae bacterium]
MCRRLMASYMLLLALVLTALEVPFGMTLASRETQRLVADRMADAMRFASLAEPALRTGETSDLSFELSRYGELYGIEAAVVDSDGTSVLTALDGAMMRHHDVGRLARKALAGQQAGEDQMVWPWRSGPLVVAAPVGGGGEYYGAVIIISPVDRLARSIGLMWLELGLSGLAALLVGLGAAWWFARWALRPVAELDAAVHHVGAGNYHVRVSDHRGPPELRRLANGFNRMTVVVADLLERQRVFVAHASHQLRNPLTALRLHIEELTDALATEEASNGHRLALEETQRLGQVLDSLLAMARADGNRETFEEIDAGRCAERRVAAWEPVARRGGISLRYCPPKEPVVVTAVATAVDQVLDAVIDNAIKFSGSGSGSGSGPEGEAHLGTEADPEHEIQIIVLGAAEGAVPGWGEIRVIDSGPGMTREQLAHATERFWRAPEVGSIDGHGLGLAIVAVLVDASEGQLDLLPVTPHGLEVRVRLPEGEPTSDLDVAVVPGRAWMERERRCADGVAPVETRPDGMGGSKITFS